MLSFDRVSKHDCDDGLHSLPSEVVADASSVSSEDAPSLEWSNSESDHPLKLPEADSDSESEYEVGSDADVAVDSSANSKNVPPLELSGQEMLKFDKDQENESSDTDVPDNGGATSKTDMELDGPPPLLDSESDSGSEDDQQEAPYDESDNESPTIWERVAEQLAGGGRKKVDTESDGPPPLPDSESDSESEDGQREEEPIPRADVATEMLTKGPGEEFKTNQDCTRQTGSGDGTADQGDESDEDDAARERQSQQILDSE